MRFRVSVLGPIGVRDPDGRDVTPAGSLPRRLLALLVLRRGTAVAADTLIDVLWPVDGPGDPLAALQSHISRLRRAMPGVIGSAPGGYRVEPSAVDVDADRLATEVAEPTGALAALLRDWHGEAYPELDDVHSERLHLDELRTRAREVVAERRITTGDLDGLAAELRTLVDEHPLRERPRALLMEVLAATGRNADALRIYDEFRRLLADEVGTDPSASLAVRYSELLAAPGWQPSHRLPATVTSLIGRDDFVRDLCDLTRIARVVTLVGPGGVGKTRLLLEIGRRAAENAVVLCELARAEPTTAAATLAAALDIDFRPGIGWVDRITSVVGESEIVLLLDNCEHVLGAVAELADALVAECPHVRIVSTSRERLRIAGEHVRVVPPLERDAATALFIQRASAAANVPISRQAAAHIVERLDGLPLAIELAAARTLSHDVDEIVAGIDRRFEFLTTGARTSTRHGSLAAAVSWSFDLLDQELRRTFTDVAIFAGPFEVTAAAAICDLDRARTDDRLAQLVERSLVMRSPGRRYVLLETLRAFGRDRLAAEGRTDGVAARHARHMVHWAESAERQLALPGSDSIRRIDDAIDELRRAVEWFVSHHDPEPAGRIVASLLDYALLRLRPDVLGWADRIESTNPRVSAVRAYAAWMADNQARAWESATRALELAGDDVPAHVYAANGVCALFDGDFRASARWYDLAATTAATTEPAYWPIPEGTRIAALGYAGDEVSSAAHNFVATIGDDTSAYAAYAWYTAAEAVLSTDPPAARVYLQRALDIATACNAAFVVGIAGASKASIDVRLGDFASAVSAYRELIPHWRRAGMWSTQWVMLRWIAVLLAAQDNLVLAAELVGALRASRNLSGDDEQVLAALTDQLRHRLGLETFEASSEFGASLPSDALLDRILRAL